MSIGSHRLLGFAFASADLLVEITPQGRIALMLDADEDAAGRLAATLVGRPWRLFVARADRPRVAALFAGLAPGRRGGPVTVRLSGEDGVARTASVCAFRQPGDPATLCALAFADPPAAAPAGGVAATEATTEATTEAGVLGAAIREKRFRLVYQPVVSLQDRALHHYEALVRFGDEESPFPRIRMAEELELIEPLDLAVLERALQVLAERAGLRLAVNVSGRTIGSARFVEQARTLIAARPETRGRLLFELTESAALDDLAQADRHLQALRALGCEICLDDFGAGAASLAYLQQLRLDILKIDGRFIRDLQHGGREATFVKHLVKMCGELGVRTLAEMVETRAAEDAVRRAGVDFAQGWLYGAAGDLPDRAPPPAARGRRTLRS